MQPCQCAAGLDQAVAPLPVRLKHLYVCGGLSTYQIGEIVGIDRQRVTRLLRRAGVTIRARGTGRKRPRRRIPDPPGLPALLEELYVRRRLTSGQIGGLLGMPERRVRERLSEYGIPVRTRGRCNREDRIKLPAEQLKEMYVLDEMSADQVARALGVSRQVVLRNAHDLGLPVRFPSPSAAGVTDREIQLIEALYTDPLVDETLRRHRIPRVPAGGPIWQRFPTPVPIGGGLLHELYIVCGIGSQHIELLTGHPSATVRRIMTGCGIPLRQPGGRSPFLRRWLGGGTGANGHAM